MRATRLKHGVAFTPSLDIARWIIKIFGIAAGSDTGHKPMATSTNDVTIADIARAAGVSVSTVSRILNNKPDVAEETRQRVRAVIEELGFTPHAQAQRLAAGRSRAIALLFPDAQRSLMREEFILGAAKAASDASYTFYLMTSDLSRPQLTALCRSALTDGIILMEIHLRDWRVSYLKRMGFPFVMIGRCANNNGISFIDMDFEHGVAQAVEYLAGLGHRKIALLALSSEAYKRGYGPAVRSRDSYVKTCRKLGLASIVVSSADIAAEVAAATHKLLDHHPGLTAMISMHGDVTIAAYRVLEERGLRIPEDISVIAFITSRTAELFTPPLTAIDFPAYEFGYQAGRMLIAQLQGSGAVEHLLPSPQLVLRRSVAALPMARQNGSA
ncbi:MAG: LacI family transcriptional regulator [Candidatus Roseilinea sp.]|uniref:LacI family DNA-binding transcriptional regulator n=1 Tax=Candidatus Roseilinea sp. NK_OTU-006 TaxID=2704250 RepID=UPI00145DF4FA|nr:LacI family DNA-binding transcriptional regulator [Candidatus Roseilinea sp. NK_OTU-006]BCX03032.1 MAG: LacI family transcriptional regulator [Candidatus Roseilinea sp.]